MTMYYLYNIKKRRLVEEVRTLKNDFARILVETKSEIREQTLSHVAMELHDDLGSIASLINIRAGIIQPENVEETKKSMEQIQELSTMLSERLSAISRSLNMDRITEVGFYDAITEYLERIRKMTTLKINLKSGGIPFRIRSDHETIIFRMCQEIINNILKHAKASKVVFEICYSEKKIEVSIEDNGQGFNSNILSDPLNRNKGNGWHNLLKRANIIEASVRIISNIGSGTTVTIVVPIEKTYE